MLNPVPLPWMIIGLLAAVGAAGTIGYVKGGTDTGNRIAADLARTAEVTRKAHDEALQAAAAQIAKLDVKSTTIRQKTEVITREVPVYGDCRHDPRTLGLLNESLAAGPAQPADSGKLPRPDPAAR